MTQASAVFATNKISLENLSVTYLHTLHTWLPIISTPDLLARSSQATPDTQSMILFLSIYLHSDCSEVSLQPIYRVVKHAWSHFQTTYCSSILLIQVGLLIAMYENGQLLEEESYSTLAECARMGYSMGLDHSLRESIYAKSTKPGLETHRRVWWAVLILERSEM